MTSTDTAESLSTPETALPLARRMALLLYATTLFVSALLLFVVQPMFTKMVLPKLGGAPSVWSVAMVSFQGFLFIGYVYAHVIARALTPTRAAIVHLLFLALVAATLPLGIAQGFSAPPADGVMFWLVGLFAASIGLPFIALSATAPLLQSWFAGTGHAQARNPYALYAASNLGSFCALLAYPFVIEPFLPLHAQRFVWSIGFSVLALLIAAAAFVGVRQENNAVQRVAASSARSTTGERLSWTVLAAIPAGLVIAVTSYISMDLVAAPFLWVIPLALYLLTFVAVFRDRSWVPHAQVLRILPYVVAPLVPNIFAGNVYWLAVILLTLIAFVLIALACHREAYLRRPAADRLTEFYLWTSFGGVLGGVFAGLIAPNLFNNIYEYPILIVAALLLLPGMFSGGPHHFLREAWPGLIAAALVIVLHLFKIRLPLDAQTPLQILLVAIAGVMLLYVKRPARFFGLVVLACVMAAFYQLRGNVIESARSFFGVYKVAETADGAYRLLIHGTTLHGAERIGDAHWRPEPLTYFYFGGPLSEVIDAARGAQGSLSQVAIIGLGTGSLACHKRDGEHWTFFEIDPEVARIARDNKYFHFLSACGPTDQIVLGDARLTVASSSGQYDLIVLDAFSSDAIPIHLLTREALIGYLARLAPQGVIAFHVSNRNMELASVVAATAATQGLIAYFKEDHGALRTDYRANAHVVVAARTEADLGDLPSRAGWHRIQPNVAAWTDDYSDVLRAILRRKIGSRMSQ